MPAFSHEVDMALKEGVEFRELLSPVSIEEKKGKYILILQKMKPLIESASDNARTRVVPDGKEKETLEVQKIFTAIGSGA